MKNKIILIALLFSITASSQINWENWKLRSPEQEFAFLETHWDYANIEPGNPDNNDKGIHAAIEFGMRSNLGRNTFGVEAKVAIESFPNLYGGFRSYGGGVGVYFVAGRDEQASYYIGSRIIPLVFRTNPNSLMKERRSNLGLECKYTYTFNEKFYFGIRLTWDTANDMEIIDRDLTGQTRWAGNFTMGCRIFKLGASK